MIIQQRRSDDEANFSEAFAEAKNAWLTPEIPEWIQELFDSEKCTQQNANEFWLCVLALKQFVDENKKLPLSGTLPDMSSATETYQKIQSL